MKELLRKLHYLLHRREYEQDLDEEMRHHLAMSAQDRGGSDAAKRQFGNITLLKEESRGMWIGTFWEQFAQDLRYGLRTMAANPLFTSMAVLSLALGIGANAAIFSFMDAILLRSLPVANPDSLVVLQWHAKEMPKAIHGLSGSMYGSKGQGRTSPNFPYAAFQELARNTQSLSQLFAYSLGRLNLVSGEQAEFAQGQFVSGGFYRSLGIVPAVGRLIVDDDDRAGATPVAVLSHRFWTQRFNGDPAAVGKSLLVNNQPFTIIGVSAPEFFGVDPSSEPAVFLPLHSIPSLEQHPADVERRNFFNRSFYWVEMMGRLRPGASLAQAQAELGEKFRQYAESTAANAAERVDLPVLRVLEGASGLDSLRRQYSKPLWVLMCMVGLILMIACANIASLLLARAAARRKEIAVRLSLGAGRGRVIRQLLTESVMMSLAGGALGLVFSLWGIRSLTWLLANGNENFTLHAKLDWTVLGFTLVLAILTGVVFGLAPALQSTRLDINGALKESKTAAVPQGRLGRFGMGRMLVAGQIALSLLFVVGAGLFVRTLSNIYSVNLGFNSENLLLFNLNARQAGYKDEALARFYEDLAKRFQNAPGIRSVGLAQMSLVSHYWNSEDLIIPGAHLSSPDGKLDTCLTRVDAGFLPTMQIPILLGRGIEERDMRAPKVAVVTEAFVKKFFPDQNPIGRHIGFNKDKPADIEIIGVARTTKYNSVKEKETPPVTYVPFTQDPERLNQMFVHIRTDREPLALASAARKIVKEAGPNVPLGEIKTQALQIDQTITEERIFARLCSAFAMLALVIACVGLYGTMAYAVARRTSEIGIRMALGAEQRRVIGMVLRDVFGLACVGVVIGLGAAWTSTKFLESYLYGVKQHDPAVLTASVIVLTAAAAIAGCVPAWRAAKIDPMVALRHE